jgi:hypothetical protein
MQKQILTGATAMANINFVSEKYDERIFVNRHRSRRRRCISPKGCLAFRMRTL